MEVLENILSSFKKEGIEFKKVEHAPVVTSADAAKIRDTKPYIGAKALVFMADEKPILIVVPGNKKVDARKFKKDFNIRDLRLLSQEELLEVTGLERGSICPLGKALKLPSYYDEVFKTQDEVVFNAGSKTVSIIMKARDLISIENPTFGNFIQY